MDETLELPIGEVARRAGVATSTIRYYESIGLLAPPDRLHGQRRYTTEVLGTLAFIGVAQNAGFKLEEIKELVQASDRGDRLGEHMRELSAHKLEEVKGLLERARAMELWLEAAQSCDCASSSECTLFEQHGDETDVTLRVVLVQGGSCRHP